MIKATFFIKLDGTTTQEQDDGLIMVTANVTFYADQFKTVEIFKRSYVFYNINIQDVNLPFIYGKLLQDFSDSEFVN